LRKSAKAIQVNDVVQVTNLENSKLKGMLFIVGGIAQGRLHGWHIVNSHKEFVTVPEADCTQVGETKIRAKQSCSFKWMSQHGE
jgi:hypothetical protein